MNGVRNIRFFGRVARLLVLAAIGALSIGQAVAQVRPSYVKNVDEPGRTPYSTSMEFTTSACSSNCSNLTTLWGVTVFDGPVVPAGKRLVVQWVSGDIASANEHISVGVQSGRIISNQWTIWQFAGPFYSFDSGGTPLYSFGTPAFFTVEPGQSPHFRLRISDASPVNYSMTLFVSGYLIDAAN